MRRKEVKVESKKGPVPVPHANVEEVEGIG